MTVYLYLIISAIIAMIVGVLVHPESSTLKGVIRCCITGLCWPIIAVMVIVSLFSGEDW